MIVLVAATALAGPPRGELVLGWAGNQDQGYGFLLGMPALAKSEDASVVLRVTTSHLYYEFFDATGTTNVASPGASLGFGFKYGPGAVSFGLATSVEVRRTTSVPPNGGASTTLTEAGAAVSGDVYAQIGRRAVVFGSGSFSGANAYLWTRAGFKHQVIPAFRRGTPAQLWLGFDVTARGNKDARALEGGLMAAIPVRALRAEFNVRGGLSVEDVGRGPVPRPTVGVGMYYSY